MDTCGEQHYAGYGKSTAAAVSFDRSPRQHHAAGVVNRVLPRQKQRPRLRRGRRLRITTTPPSWQAEADTNDPEELEVIQRFWYYPFGMAMQGLRDWATEPGQWYRYNGKERDTVSGWYEYGFRWYIDEIGRFAGVDPIADQFPHVSVFNYAENSRWGV